jgi:hypothetical protein
MSRSYINSVRLEQLAQTISPKELAILKTLQEVRLASASQLERLHFVGETSRNRRRVLQSMTERGLVTHLDRVVGGRRPGSASFLYGLGVAGQRLLAEHQGRPVRRPTLPGVPFLAHTLAITELAVRLREAEQKGQIEVLTLQTEPRCWRRHPGPGGVSVICKPDAYVRLGVGSYEDSYFIELDLSTESPNTLARKLAAYRALWSSGVEQASRGVFPKVIWLVPDLRRYQVVVDVCSSRPAETWQLHQVTLFEDAVGLMVEGPS